MAWHSHMRYDPHHGNSKTIHRFQLYRSRKRTRTLIKPSIRPTCLHDMKTFHRHRYCTSRPVAGVLLNLRGQVPTNWHCNRGPIFFGQISCFQWRQYSRLRSHFQQSYIRCLSKWTRTGQMAWHSHMRYDPHHGNSKTIHRFQLYRSRKRTRTLIKPSIRPTCLHDMKTFHLHRYYTNQLHLRRRTILNLEQFWSPSPYSEKADRCKLLASRLLGYQWNQAKVLGSHLRTR